MNNNTTFDMSIYNTPISVTYTDAEQQNLVEEYITQQKSEFTLKGVCSFILYCAVEDHRVVCPEGGLCEANALQPEDQRRIKSILHDIVTDGRIVALGADSFKKVTV